MKNLSNEDLLNEYRKFNEKRKLFLEKIDLHSYYEIFSLWLDSYINDDRYKIDLAYNFMNNPDEMYRTPMSVEMCKEIAHDFYHDLGEKMGENFDSIINNKENKIINIDKNVLGETIKSTSFSSVSDDLVDSHLYGLIEVKNYNTIETLYGLVHESMHAMTTVDNKYTESTFAVREVPTYFVESLLSDYLLKNYKKYNLDKENIVHDVSSWKLARYFDYFDREKGTYNTEYFLGLLLASKFDQLSNSKKKQQLKLFIYYLNIDRIDIALKCIDFKLGQENRKERSPYLKALTSNFMDLVKNMQKDDSFTPSKTFR